MVIPSWNGVFTGALLPLQSSGAIDWPALRKQLHRLADARLSGIFINANIGEGPFLNEAERGSVLGFAQKEVGSRIPLIASIMPTGTEEACEHARRARELGASALLVFPHPAFADSPLDPRMPVSYFSALGEASGLPLVVYQATHASGMRFDAEPLARIIELEHVAAIKEGSWESARYAECAQQLAESAGEDVALLADGDYLLPQLMALGADGATVSCAVIHPWLWKDLLNGELDGDTAQKLIAFASAVFADPFWQFRARLKAVLVEGGEFVSAEMRRPLLARAPGQHAELLGLARELTAIESRRMK